MILYNQTRKGTKKNMKKEIALNVFYTLSFFVLIRYLGIVILYFSVK